MTPSLFVNGNKRKNNVRRFCTDQKKAATTAGKEICIVGLRVSPSRFKTRSFFLFPLCLDVLLQMLLGICLDLVSALPQELSSTKLEE